MKKISTLIAICMSVSLSTLAQWDDNNHNGQQDDNRGYGNGDYSHDGNRDYRNGNYNNDNRYYNFRTESELLNNLNLTRQQQRRVMRISEEYKDKSFRIQNNRWISAQQKRFQLERLEQQRRQEIMNLLSGFQRDRYNSWCSRNTNSSYGNGGYGNGRW